MKKKIVPVGLAGLVGVGLLSVPAVASLNDEPAVKREDNVAELVVVDDNDDGDDPTGNTQGKSKDASADVSKGVDGEDTADDTRSQASRMTRDQSRSIATQGDDDLTGDRAAATAPRVADDDPATRDFTRDLTRDVSRDVSRDDTASRG